MDTTNGVSGEGQKVQIIPSPDRLSDLPDSVLCHILSFVPTKLSVSTSILARRWRFLWADVPNLDFDVVNYDKDTFSAIINRVMMTRNMGPINTFRLSSCKKDLCPIELDTWIRTAVARNVQALYLVLNHQPLLPRCIFTCKSLVDLRLHAGIGIAVGNLCLPSLKKLHLHSVWFRVKNLVHLISGCPVLEELSIGKVLNRNLVRFNISSPTIKRFILNSRAIHYRKLEINTPALTYLCVQGELLNCISAGTLNSLVEADICLKDDELIDDILCSRSVLEFVERLCQVKCLRLSVDYVKFLDSAFVADTRFRKLTKLELAADWRFPLKFLEIADNLEVLIIRKVIVIDEDGEDLTCWMKPQQGPTCLSTHLKQVTFNEFNCSDHEFELVGYILKNAKVLKMMEIHAEHLDPDFQTKFNATQRILRFERGSDKCKIEFY